MREGADSKIGIKSLIELYERLLRTDKIKKDGAASHRLLHLKRKRFLKKVERWKGYGK